METIKTTKLKYNTKVYEVVLTRERSGYFVTGYNGRRGDTLIARPQNKEPVSREQADKLFNALVQKKLKHRDTPYEIEGEGGGETPVHQLPRTEPSINATDLQPQLLTALEDPSLVKARLNDNIYSLQPKLDGKRILLVAEPNGTIYPYNRTGSVCAVAQSILDDAKKLHDKIGPFILDGESVGASGFAGGEQFFAFDILSLDGRNLRAEPFVFREEVLRQCVPLQNSPALRRAVTRVATAFRPAEKKAMVRTLYAQAQEGGVFKKADSPYLPGRRKDQFKLKFTVDSTFVVVKVNTDHASVQLGLFDDKGKLHPLGNCTVRDARFRVSEGSVIDVRYLNAHRESGSPYQPRMIRIRDDVGLEACTMDQLYYKGDPRPTDQLKELLGL